MTNEPARNLDRSMSKQTSNDETRLGVFQKSSIRSSGRQQHGNQQQRWCHTTAKKWSKSM